MWGDAATPENDWAYDYLPKLDVPAYDVLRVLLHNNPAHPWTVAMLAEASGGSRGAALARRFTELVGEAPMTFLTNWKTHPCGRPASRTGRHCRLRRQEGRLWQPVCPEHSLQAHPRHQPAATPSQRLASTTNRCPSALVVRR